MASAILEAERLVAHRGWRNRYPENTLAAVEAAIAVGALHVEIDIQLSADGIAMVFHDPALQRMCQRDGSIFDFSAAELESFTVSEAKRLGSNETDTTICRLEDVAELLSRHPQVTLYVEIKEESIARFSHEVVLQAVDDALATVRRQAVPISFDLEILQLARHRGWSRVCPVLSTWEQLQAPIMSELQAVSVFCDQWLVPPDIALRDLQQRLTVYEVENAERARHWLQQGAWQVETYCIGELLAENNSHATV